MKDKNPNIKEKILLVSSDHSLGMIHFAASIINKLSENPHIEFYSILTEKGNYNYKNKLTPKALERAITIECPQNKFINGLYKVIPIDIATAIKKTTKKYNIKKIHFLTGDFRMWSFIKLFNFQYYYTVHDLTPHERKISDIKHKLLSKYMNWSYKYNTQHIHNLITCSKEQYEELKEIYPKKNIQFAHFPSLVNNEIANGNLKVKELKDIDNYILFFGGVDYYKGVDILVEAYERIKHKLSIPLVIAGKGIHFEGNNIIAINRVIDDKEIKDLFSKATVVVYPYRSITMSGVLSIAYYFKKNVIISDLGFFLQNKSKNTQVFKNGNTEDLAKTLAETISNLSDMSTAYDEIYSGETMINQYLSFYITNLTDLE